MFLPKDIPGLAWAITSISGLILSSGFAWSTIKSASYSVKFADIQIETTEQKREVDAQKVENAEQLAKVIQYSSTLEQKINDLQEREEANNKLLKQYQTLIKYNQPLKMLEPAIKEVERVNKKNELEEIEKAIEATAQAASENIAEIADESKPDEPKVNQDDEIEQQ